MTESQAVAKQALKKLEDQLTCAICLEAFNDPKLLHCFHVYCKDCLQRLVVQDQQGQVSVLCPTCRKSTVLLHGSSVSDLQPAFHIHHLFEIQDALEKAREPQKVVCGNCTKDTRTATSYCRGCGEFICATCVDIHTQWDRLSKHEVVPLEEFEKKVKQLDVLKTVTLYCSLHQGKELELYCETCEELVCHNCIVKKHKDHQYDLVIDTFEQQRGEMVACLEPVEGHLEDVNKALVQMEAQLKAVITKRDAIAAEIRQKTLELQEMLELRKDELISQLDETTQQMVKNLATQKDEVETIQTQLVSCLSFVRESLKTGSQGEVMRIKKAVVSQIKEITNSIKPEKLCPCESPNLTFLVSPEIAQYCRQFGEVFKNSISAEKSYATGKGLKVAVPGEEATAVVHICDTKGNVYSKPIDIESLTCDLISDNSHDKMIVGTINTIEVGKYEVSYQPTIRGRHQLCIKVEGEHIKGSPFPVIVKPSAQSLGAPVKTIEGVNEPWGVAINQKGEIIVAEHGGNCVSIFSLEGRKVHSFGSHGAESGQFNEPYGVAIDDIGNIFVTDGGNNRIQKFSADGKFLTMVGSEGCGQLQFDYPVGIRIHPQTKKIYVADHKNHRVQILNPDLTYFGTSGSYGSGPGQLMKPEDTGFDSANNVYVVDTNNDRIQVFSEDGVFLRQIGKKGTGSDLLHWPTAIAINDENEVYIANYRNHVISVFTTQGDYLTCFGRDDQYYPCGIAVDLSGMMYIAYYGNGYLKVF